MTSPRRSLRYGMVGGGPDAFIGAVHRRAAAFDGLAVLTAGAFSSDPAKSRAQGEALGLDPRRVYPSFEAMAEAEAALPEGERIDLVSIVTPNHLHYRVARAFVERGFHVVCDKPLATSLADAETLCRLADERGLVFAVTQNHSAHPMVRQARAMVRDGTIGEIRKVVVEYVQGWLATPVEETGNRQAAWRTDPEQAGAGAIGDIGTHAFHLLTYVTGLAPERLYADVTTFVPGRRVDDDATMLLHFAGEAKGVLAVSQVAVGEENRLSIRVYGTRGSLEWRQEEPTLLVHRTADGPARHLTPGHPWLSDAAAHASRLPPGHPQGFSDAFANVYGNVARTILARVNGVEPDPLDLDFPTVQDGARGVHFIETVLRSAERDEWVDAAYTPPRGPRRTVTSAPR